MLPVTQLPGVPADECAPISSAMHYFFDPATDALYNPKAVARQLAEHGVYQYTDRFFSLETLGSNVTRATLAFGLPLAGYASWDDRQAEQKAKYRAFLTGSLLPALERDSRESPTVRLLYFDAAHWIMDAEVNAAVGGDCLVAVASLVFVGVFIGMHTHSVWLGLLGTLCILCSFPLAYFTYVRAFGVRKMTVPNFLALFIVMGVGADDIFVFVDCWRQVSGQRKVTRPAAHSTTTASRMFLTDLPPNPPPPPPPPP